MSLAPAIILLLTMSPFNISFLLYLVQLTRIMTPCTWTLHIFYHFCPSNGHQKLVIVAICFWLTVSEHKAWFYCNNSDKHQTLLLLGCPLLKQKPSSIFFESTCPKSQDRIAPRAISHLYSSTEMTTFFKKFHGSFPSIFPYLYILVFLVALGVCNLFCFLDGMKPKTVIDLPFVSSLLSFPTWDLPAFQYFPFNYFYFNISCPPYFFTK